MYIHTYDPGSPSAPPCGVVRRGCCCSPPSLWGGAVAVVAAARCYCMLLLFGFMGLCLLDSLRNWLLPVLLDHAAAC